MGASAGKDYRRRSTGTERNNAIHSPPPSVMLQEHWMQIFQDQQLVEASKAVSVIYSTASSLGLQISETEANIIVSSCKIEGSDIVARDRVAASFEEFIRHHASRPKSATIDTSVSHFPLMAASASNFLVDHSGYDTCTWEVLNYVRSLIQEQRSDSYLSRLPRDVLDMVISYAKQSLVISTTYPLKLTWAHTRVCVDTLVMTPKVIAYMPTSYRQQGSLSLTAISISTGQCAWLSDIFRMQGVGNAVVTSTTDGQIAAGLADIILCKPPSREAQHRLRLPFAATVVAMHCSTNFLAALIKPTSTPSSKSLVWFRLADLQYSYGGVLPDMVRQNHVRLYATETSKWANIAIVNIESKIYVCFPGERIEAIADDFVHCDAHRGADPIIVDTRLFYSSSVKVSVYDLENLSAPLIQHSIAPTAHVISTSLRANLDGTITAIGTSNHSVRLLVLDAHGKIVYSQTIYKLPFVPSNHSAAWFVSEDTLLLGGARGVVGWVSLGNAKVWRQEVLFPAASPIERLYVNGSYLVASAGDTLRTFAINFETPRK